MFTHRFCTAALLIGAIGCASGSSSSRGQPTDAAPKINPDVITAAELTDRSELDNDALQAVRHLRPRFLVTRGTVSVNNKSAGSVHIAVNGGGLQTIDNLGRIRANEIVEMRYLSPSDAAQRFGASAASGAVILVKTK